MIRKLLLNAMKHTERGKVLLGCRRRGDKLRIEVWDTGTGIPGSNFARSWRNSINPTIMPASTTVASASVFLSCNAWQSCWTIPSMFNPVQARARSSLSRHRSEPSNQGRYLGDAGRT